MNKKQYNNVIDWTVKHEKSAQGQDALETARAIFNNMGVALPNGSISEVYETIKTDDYMGWRCCTMQEAQAAADKGTAAIGISKDRIVVLSAADEEEPVAQTASVMTLSENTSAYAVSDLQYYSYSYATEDDSPGLTKRFDSLVGRTLTKIPTGTFNGQCINYAMLRMREISGMQSPGINYTSPLHWFNTERGENRSGYYSVVDSSSYDILTSNYCAIFNIKGSPFGHVIYLEYVQKDVNGNILNVYFTEANGDNNGTWDSGTDGVLTKMSFSDFKRERTGFIGLIVQSSERP